MDRLWERRDLVSAGAQRGPEVSVGRTITGRWMHAPAWTPPCEGRYSCQPALRPPPEPPRLLPQLPPHQTRPEPGLPAPRPAGHLPWVPGHLSSGQASPSTSSCPPQPACPPRPAPPSAAPFACDPHCGSGPLGSVPCIRLSHAHITKSSLMTNKTREEIKGLRRKQ